MRKFVLLVKYGCGEAAMLTDNPDLVNGIMEFKHHYMKGMPDTKEFGMPEITRAQIMPIMYDSIYEGNDEDKSDK